jgi:hypothetical protein
MLVMSSRSLLIYYAVVIAFSLALLKIGYTLIHSGIFILLILSPAYFYMENNGRILSPDTEDIMVYLSTQLLYYSLVIKIYIYIKNKTNKNS